MTLTMQPGTCKTPRSCIHHIKAAAVHGLACQPRCAASRRPTAAQASSQQQRELDTSSSASPTRQAISSFASAIYKAAASFQAVDALAPPLWQFLLKLDLAGVQAAIRKGEDINQPNDSNETPLLYIAKEGHYKYPPAEIPALLIQSGADLEAKDSNGLTALQVSLLAGWQNIAELLLKNGAQTDGVAAIKDRVTCPDCKRIIAQYNL